MSISNGTDVIHTIANSVDKPSTRTHTHTLTHTHTTSPHIDTHAHPQTKQCQYIHMHTLSHMTIHHSHETNLEWTIYQPREVLNVNIQPVQRPSSKTDFCKTLRALTDIHTKSTDMLDLRCNNTTNNLKCKAWRQLVELSDYQETHIINNSLPSTDLQHSNLH